MRFFSTLFAGRKKSADDFSISFIKRGGWLGENLVQISNMPDDIVFELIEARALATDEAGARPLWEGYREVRNYPRSTTGTRRPNDVRTPNGWGKTYARLAERCNARAVVEFGTAFGVSGMYWLAGLRHTGGHLYTFEPNADWASYARSNLAAVSDAFTLTIDTFEAAGPRILAPASVDLAFVDAIHTGAFVRKQYGVLKPLMTAGGLILFDDIAFSDDMQSCWREIAQDPALVASATIGRRVGVIELP